MAIRDWRTFAGTGRALIGLWAILAIAGAGTFVCRFWPDPPPPHEAADIGSVADYLARTLDEHCQVVVAAKGEDDPTPRRSEECADRAAALMHNHASLQQAARAADAAAYSAYIGYLQTCIGIIGVLLLIATLMVAVGALVAAFGSARRALEETKTPRDTVT